MTNNFGLARGLRLLSLIAAPAFLLAQTPVAKDELSQVANTGGTMGKPFVNSDKDTRPYNKHDFNGFWARNPSAQYGQPPCPECRDPGPSYGYFGDVPPLTPAGEKRFAANKPTKGYLAGSKQAEEHKDLNIAYRRAVQSSESNDPEERCEPLGLTRLVSFSGGNPPMHIVQTNEVIIERFEWFWDNREIWTDGRGLPKVDDYLPRFNGYSVGNWEGDTLVVTTVGFDSREWVDAFGFPISEKAVLEAPEPKSVETGHDVDRSRKLYPAMALQHQGLGPDPERSPDARGLVRNCGRPLRPLGERLLHLV
jgi:hypothetical protein